MNLLPRSNKDFGQKSYWDEFFKKRGKRSFEWYGEYAQLGDYLSKYIKLSTKILIVGCGNSILGNDLYDNGYRNITSIDISHVAIRQMQSVNEKRRPEMRFLQMDAMAMTFADEVFETIIDKGTLDALMPDAETETLARVENYFNEMLRVISILGRYVCISLLQEHILQALLNHFPPRNCLMKISRCLHVEKHALDSGESPMPVFLIVFVKMKSLPRHVFELNLTTKGVTKVETAEEVLKLIADVQQAAFVSNSIRNSNATFDNIEFDLFRPNESTPRFRIFVTDGSIRKDNKPHAAFIVPQGREAEWLFATRQGRKQLATISECNRLVVIALNRDHDYACLASVQEEVEECVKNLALSTIASDYKIPFLSLGSDLGSRTIIHKGHSEASGDYVIEDVLISNETFRRLFYLSSQFVIQSEAKLCQHKSRRGNVNTQVDLTYLTCNHHIYISAALRMQQQDNQNALVIGLGGGGLCSFLHRFLPHLHITAVDIDPHMLQIAKQWFGLQVNEHLNVEIQDGLIFLQKNADNVYHSIIFDVDSKDHSIGMSCPPQQFLSNCTLKDVRRSLAESGLFVLNLVLRDFGLRSDIVESLKKHFVAVASYKLEEELNEIFFCFNTKVQESEIRNAFTLSMSAINAFFRKCKHDSLVSDVNGENIDFL